jgi:hypothetical protein
MIAEDGSHADVWLMLPWLANGRLAGAERLRVEEHVRGCALCAREVALQRRLCEVLIEPERVTYAPGPSFRKLMNRIDGRAPRVLLPVPRAARLRRFAARGAAAWRPPGLAWAASVLLAIGFLGFGAITTYRWSQPRYVTHTAESRPAPAAASAGAVLHIAFIPSISIGEVGDALQRAGARVVEGPDTTGVFGVTPLAASADGGEASRQLRALAARLHVDARIRWIEPLPGLTPAQLPQRGPPPP